MKAAIYGRRLFANHLPYFQNLIRLLLARNVQVKMHERLFQYTKELEIDTTNINSFKRHSDVMESVDVLFSLGGDGTLLDSTRYVKASGTPIMGINMGRLGFLATAGMESLEHVVDSIMEKRVELDARATLKLVTDEPIFDGDNFALNEITIHKKDSSSMVKVKVSVDGEYLNTYWSDGLIISTPTGSTAYSMSCGGPIVMPGSGNFCITPIAPHNLNVRPIIIPDSAKLCIEMEGNREENYLISMDSRSATLHQKHKLFISKNDFVINLIKLSEESFLDTLRNKLNWGLDKRN